MGYRLFGSIPNVAEFRGSLELGKQYDEKWDDFNHKWFGDFRDGGMIYRLDLQQFLTELKDVNAEPGRHDLYNIEALEEMVQHAILYGYDMYFISR